jgi:hypothetical protein
MKKVFSKIRSLVIMSFAAVTAFISKAMWQTIDNDRDAQQWFYWVRSPVGPISVAEASWPSFLSLYIDTIVKWIEIVLVAVIFIVWLVSFLKIRKIEDKELKSKKIKKAVIAIVVLLAIGLLVLLWYGVYYRIFFADCCASAP